MRSKVLRIFVAAFAICTVAAVAIACGGDYDDKPGGTGTPATTGPVTGGEITVQHRQFASLDPHFTAFARDISIIGMIFRGLYQLDENDQLQPELAAALPVISSDGKTYKVALKPNLEWSDGTPLTAKDVVAGILRTCNPVVAGQYSASLFNIVGCEEYYSADTATATEQDALMTAVGVRQLGDLEVEITLEQPQATFATQLALWFSWPVPTHILATPGAEWPTDPTKLVFSGPFKVDSYREKDRLVIVRNENYGGAHLAYLDKVTLRFIDDLETANNAFRSGEVLAAWANPAALDALRADLGEQLTTPAKSASRLGLWMMSSNPPLDNPKLRLALSQATDRETMNRVVLKNANIPSTSWIPEDLLGLPADPFAKAIGYDPEAAKKSYAESGLPKGQELSVMIPDSPDAKVMAAFLKEQWKIILGIELGVQLVDGPTYSKNFQQDNFQIILQGWTHDYPDPENWVDGLFNTGGTNNHFGCKNPEIDRLLAEAKVNLDNEKRLELYREMNRLISEEICGMAPLFYNRIFSLVDSSLKGAREHSTSQDHYLPGDWAIEEWYLAK